MIFAREAHLYSKLFFIMSDNDETSSTLCAIGPSPILSFLPSSHFSCFSCFSPSHVLPFLLMFPVGGQEKEGDDFERLKNPKTFAKCMESLDLGLDVSWRATNAC